MADQTNVALIIASREVEAVTKFMDALDEMEAILAHAKGAGLNMVDFDEALSQQSRTAHISGQSFNRAFNVVTPAIRIALQAGVVGDDTYEDILFSVKR